MRKSFAVARHKRKKKILKDVKGFRHRIKNNCNLAINARIKKFKNEYIGRKQRKRQYRSLWITRINAFVRNLGTNYSNFMSKFLTMYPDNALNRKSLAEMAISKPDALEKIVKSTME